MRVRVGAEEGEWGEANHNPTTLLLVWLPLRLMMPSRCRSSPCARGGRQILVARFSVAMAGYCRLTRGHYREGKELGGVASSVEGYMQAYISKEVTTYLNACLLASENALILSFCFKKKR